MGGSEKAFKQRGDMLWKCHFDGSAAEGRLLGDCDDSPGKGQEPMKHGSQGREHSTERLSIKEKPVRCGTRLTGK